jgi:hypothetical protein
MDPQQLMDYARDTTIYGRFKVWHLVMFLMLGPIFTWPMLFILGAVLVYENRNIVKEVQGIFTSNGGNQRATDYPAGRDQGAPQGPAQG